MLTILVAGNELLYDDLLEHLPASCRVTYCKTIDKALDRADEASVVLVDVALPGGSENLCHRLRAREETARIPIFVYSDTPVETRYADRVLSGGLQQTLGALREHFPEAELRSIPGATYRAAATGAAYQSEAETVRRPMENALPTSPPIRKAGQDLLGFAQDFTDFIASLVGMHDARATLSDDEQQQMADVFKHAVAAAESALDDVQGGVNEALRAQNLGRMRELSAAKTALFERLRSLRTILGYTSASYPRVPDTQKGQSHPGSKSDSLPAIRRSTPGAPAPTGLAPQKSAITLAAERKRRQRAAAPAGTPAAGKRRAPQRAQKTPRNASPRRADQRKGSSWLWPGIVAALVIAAVVVGVKLRRRQESPTSRGENAAPVMKFVTIQETLGGMIARPEAEDAEGDRVIYNIRWFVDGEVVADANTARLTTERYKPGSPIQVEVTPSDPHGSGQAMVSQPLTATRGAAQTKGL